MPNRRQPSWRWFPRMRRERWQEGLWLRVRGRGWWLQGSPPASCCSSCSRLGVQAEENSKSVCDEFSFYAPDQTVECYMIFRVCNSRCLEIRIESRSRSTTTAQEDIVRSWSVPIRESFLPV